MFDISFSELLVVVVVALLVIGPEKLPKVARTLGAYAGRMQRFVAQVKDEVNREVRFEELQKLQQEVKTSTMAAESSIVAGVGSIQQDVRNAISTPSVSPVKPVTKKVDSGELDIKAVSDKATSATNKARVKKTSTIKSDNGVQSSKPSRVRKKVAN